MKYIFSSMFFYEYSITMIANAAKLAEYDGVEFWLETPHFWIDRKLEKIECFGDMYLAIHAPVLDLNPASVNEKVRELTLIENMYAVDLARKLSASPVTIHAGKRTANREPIWADYLALHDFLRVLSRYAKIKGVIISLENSEPKLNYLCKDVDELEEFLSTYEISFTFDIKHALQRGNATEFVERLFDKIVNVHVSYYDKKGRHIEPSKGKEVAKILRILSDFGYNGVITIELDDLGFGNIDYNHKIKILKREIEFVKSFF